MSQKNKNNTYDLKKKKTSKLAYRGNVCKGKYWAQETIPQGMLQYLGTRSAQYMRTAKSAEDLSPKRRWDTGCCQSGTFGGFNRAQLASQ